MTIEAPMVTKSNMDQPFQLAVIATESPRTIKTDKEKFAEHFRTLKPGATAARFNNKENDSRFVVPTVLSGNSRAYYDVASFLRYAPPYQVDRTWKMVVSELSNLLESGYGYSSWWLSTSGADCTRRVHFRLDTLPKYYYYSPFKGDVFAEEGKKRATSWSQRSCQANRINQQPTKYNAGLDRSQTKDSPPQHGDILTHSTRSGSNEEDPGRMSNIVDLDDYPEEMDSSGEGNYDGPVSYLSNMCSWSSQQPETQRGAGGGGPIAYEIVKQNGNTIRYAAFCDSNEVSIQEWSQAMTKEGAVGDRLRDDFNSVIAVG